MLLYEPIAFIAHYVNMLNDILSEEQPNWKMSKIQKLWLGLVLSCMLLSNSLNWTLFDKITLGKISINGYCWMFNHGKLLWNKLMIFSVQLVIKTYKLTEGVLVIDDTDRPRSKNTKNISKVHTMKDKGTSGFMKGQNIVFLLLITEKVTFPVGFLFYMPDPVMKAWKKEDKKLIKQNIPKSERPPKPSKDPRYPTKSKLALQLMIDFKMNFPTFKVKAILADGLYGHDSFLEGAKEIFQSQVISQLRSNQLVKVPGSNEYQSLSKYFKSKTSKSVEIYIRGSEKQQVKYVTANLLIKSQGKTRRIVALKYDGEDEYRYIVVTNKDWMVTTIVQTYTLRWLVEVFFFDWKQSEGWANMAKQQGDEGSSRGLILSMLLDHCLLLHPDQKARIDDKLSACTVGSLRAKICTQSIIQFIENILESRDPFAELTNVKDKVNNLLQLFPSKKHMNVNKLNIFESDGLAMAA